MMSCFDLGSVSNSAFEMTCLGVLGNPAPILACLELGSTLEVTPIFPFGNNLKFKVTDVDTSLSSGYDCRSTLHRQSARDFAEKSLNWVPSSNVSILSVNWSL